MNRMNQLAAVGLFTAAICCTSFASDSPARAEAPVAQKLEAPSDPVAVAEIHNAAAHAEKITGSVKFTQAGDSVKVVIDVDGLSPGDHGIHIHQSPDLSAPDLKSAGGHYNPKGHKHGGPDAEEHHAGDLGNLTADDKGHAHLEETIKGLAVVGVNNPVVGHSVIIHEKADDLKSDPAGNSGARIAGGAIVLQKGQTGKN